jgi:hypothetical protein
MLPTTIDGVVSRLEDIITTSVATSDRRGYFAALYNRVTRRVRDGIQHGEFEDNPRMELLDVNFANRYLEAYDLYAGGAHPTRPWRRTFDAAAQDGLFVLQHLLLGMTTHIMLDLGIAAAATAPGASLPAMRKDFLHINALLGEEIDLVEGQLIAITGAWRPALGALLGLADAAALQAEETAARLLINTARARAWDFAGRLADTPPAAWGPLIEQHEAATAVLCEAVLVDAPLVDLLGGDGSHDVAGNIRTLAQGEGVV